MMLATELKPGSYTTEYDNRSFPLTKFQDERPEEKCKHINYDA
jgi:hypothetical protein